MSRAAERGLRHRRLGSRQDIEGEVPMKHQFALLRGIAVSGPRFAQSLRFGTPRRLLPDLPLSSEGVAPILSGCFL